MDVYQQITADFFNEFNTEIRRGKYPETKLNVNWFDAVFAEDDRRGTTRLYPKAGSYFEDSSDGIKAQKSDLKISDIP